MQSSQKGILFLLLVLGLAIGSGALFAWQVNSGKVMYGLDVRGGMRLTYEMNLDKLTAEQRQRLPEIKRNVRTIMEARVSQALGVQEGNVSLKEPNQVVVELPGYTDVETARQTMRSTAKIIAYHANNVQTTKREFREYREEDTTTIDGAPVVTFSRRNDPEKVLKPGDPEYARMISGWKVILEGDDLASAAVQVMGNFNQPSFNFSSTGAQKMERWSKIYNSQGEKIAFVLDGRVLNIAPIREGAVISREAYIEGNFEPTYVKRFVDLLNAGALPVDLAETSSQKIDPTLGVAALHMMVMAGLISFGLIILFLLGYYLFPGFVAMLALCLYILFTLTVLILMNATFSLAAIAGFILSVGMAVDANILVFERVKEEMRTDKELMKAVELGFKRAFPAILDSNMCTILTSIVLFFFGTGPVKGFATTLIIGVAISLFTAITVTRSLLVFMVSSGLGRDPKWFGLNRQWMGEGDEEHGGKVYHIVDTSKKWFLISLATIIPGAIFIFMGGLKPNVEFLGGFEMTVKQPAAGALSAEQITSKLDEGGYRGSRVTVTTAGDGMRQAIIQVPPSPSIHENDPKASAVIAETAGYRPEDVLAFTSVGPLIQKETIRNAVYGVVLSTLLITLYLTARFGFVVGSLRNGLKFGLSAIGALIHDVLVVLGVAAIVGHFMNWQVSALFITSMLTVIGFSVHDTVVIFDRIRENLRKTMKGEDFGHLCNRSITQSFARSINTSMTVIVTLVILIVWGAATPELKFFALAMLVGILSGTYSSIYNASPILYLWDKAVMKRRGEEHGLMAEADRETQRQRAAALRLEAGPGAVGVMSDRGGAADRGYGQVKRRQSAQQKATQIIDDDE